MTPCATTAKRAKRVAQETTVWTVPLVPRVIVDSMDDRGVPASQAQLALKVVMARKAIQDRVDKQVRVSGVGDKRVCFRCWGQAGVCVSHVWR